QTERLETLEPVIARGRGKDARACTLGELDGRDAHAAGAGLHEHRLARLEVPELEETIMCRSERHGHHGGELHVAALRNLPGGARGDGAQFGMRAVETGSDGLVAGLEVLDLGADLDHLARRL